MPPQYITTAPFEGDRKGKREKKGEGRAEKEGQKDHKQRRKRRRKRKKKQEVEKKQQRNEKSEGENLAGRFEHWVHGSFDLVEEFLSARAESKATQEDEKLDINTTDGSGDGAKEIEKQSLGSSPAQATRKVDLPEGQPSHIGAQTSKF